MEAGSETIETTAPGLIPSAEGASRPLRRRSAGRRLDLRSLPLTQVRFAVAVYFGTRVLLLLVALLERELRHQRLITELANWDGMWFRALAHHGYPTHVSHEQTTLGFFPLYPISMWAVAHVVTSSDIAGITIAGVIISGLGGLIATVLVQRLTTGWWGEESGRRATLLFCLLPGSVVFSMVYSEGLLMPLAAGCILALERRRWLLAGALAGVATAVQPAALSLIPVCAVSAALHLRRHGWHERSARRSLLAPLVSLAGVAGFAAFLWVWTGTPLANYEGQHYGWDEKTDPLALVHQATTLIGQISLRHFNHPTINLNLPVGLIGAVVLAAGLVLLVRWRGRVSPEAMVWTFAISFLAVTSSHVPPNPRLLITAFPAMLVFAHRYRGRSGTLVMVANGVLLAGMSYLTFVGNTLRP